MPTDWRSIRVEFVVPEELLSEGVLDGLLLAIRDAVYAQPYGSAVQNMSVSLHDLPNF